MANTEFLAICDPVAVQEFGHNLAALSRYSKHLERFCNNIYIYAGASLSSCNIDLGSFFGKFIYHYSHYYSRLIQLPPDRLDKTGRMLLGLSSQEAHEAAKRSAIAELKRILDKACNYNRPIIFFPSIDYYSLFALASLSDEIKNSTCQVLIRFIGVLESSSYYSKEGETFDSIMNILSLATRDPKENIFHFSAESPVLASRFRREYGLNVSVTPTLVDEDPLPETDSKRFTLAFPGSARIDKGYDKILNILQELDARQPFLDYRVYLQSLPTSELVHHYNIQRDLFKHPRIRAYPAKVNQDELKNYIQKSHLLILPYCPNIYQERSSAMMAEAACFGRQVVASSNCGFSSQIESLGIGQTCNNAIEMAEAIANYSLLTADSLKLKAAEARKSYKNHIVHSYDSFFSFSS